MRRDFTINAIYVDIQGRIFDPLNGISDLQVKDLRNWFNHKLKSHYGFTTKEASAYLGHSPEVNEYHYDPISEDVIQEKLNALTVTQLLPRESVKA